ncbi:putative zinc-binding protein [Candidatus Latescibacterota bacterium]
MQENNCGCTANVAPTLIFPCSGAADVGEISDRAARKLTRDGAGKMFCLAGLGGHVESFITNTNAAGKIIVIDGCPVDCAKKTLEHAGFADFEHIRITDLGCEKGKSPAADDTVTRIAAEINTMLLS